MINVTKTFLPSFKNYQSYLKKIYKNGWITNNGPFEKELTKKLKLYFKIKNIEIVSNGTIAIQIAIKSLGLKGQIITTPYSYVATTNAILWEGLQPVFVDIEEKTFCIDADKIEKAITDKTVAILATHIYGYPCNIEKIKSISKKYNLKVIYDAAHAFGVKIGEKHLVDFGDISTLSFHATKLFHTVEGGAIVCKDREISQKVFLLKTFGHIGEDKYIEVGINAKNSELHDAMGLCILSEIDEIIAERKRISEIYDESLSGLNIQTPLKPKNLKYNYSYYPIIFETYETMQKVRNALIKNEIMPRRYFYPSLNTLPYLEKRVKKRCPVSESIANRVLCIPLFVGLRKKDQLKIVKIIRENLN